MSGYIPTKRVGPKHTFGETLLWGFEAADAIASSSGTVVADTTNKRQGSQGIKVTSTNSVQARFDIVPPAALTSATVLELDFYIDNITNLTSVGVLFTANNYTGFLKWQTSPTNGSLRNGWNRARFHVRDCFNNGTGQTVGDWSASNLVRFSVVAGAGVTVNVTFDNLRAITSRPVVTLTFDDGRVSQHDYAMKILREYGWAGTLYLATNCVGNASFSPAGGGTAWSGLSLTQLRNMQTAGWDIGVHTSTHPDLTTLTSGQQDTEFSTAWTYCRDNDLGQGKRFFATPYGKKDANTLASAAKYHSTLRDASAAGHSGYESHGQFGMLSAGTDSGPTQYALRYQEIVSADGTSLATVQGWVDETIRLQSWLILVFHDIGPDNSWCSEALFRSYLEYFNTKRAQIDVMNMSQYWDNLTQMRRIGP